MLLQVLQEQNVGMIILWLLLVMEEAVVRREQRGVMV
jgi:hypothetical protein